METAPVDGTAIIGVKSNMWLMPMRYESEGAGGWYSLDGDDRGMTNDSFIGWFDCPVDLVALALEWRQDPPDDERSDKLG